MNFLLLIKAFFKAFKWWLRGRTLPVPIPVHKPQMQDLTETEVTAMAVDAIKRTKAHAQFKQDYKHLTYQERREIGLLNVK
jgi:hypothetical protein